MTDDVILTAEQVAAWWNDGDDAVMDKRVRDSHEALRARLAEVERERDEWRERWRTLKAGRDDFERLMSHRITDAEADVRELTEALRKYGRHTAHCASIGSEIAGGTQRPCTCDLGVVLGVVLGEQEATPPEPPKMMCQRVGCPEVAITRFSDGRGDVFWLCEKHGDALAVGFPVRPPAAASPGEPERCPTCGTDDPAHPLYGCMAQFGETPDPWHSGEQSNNNNDREVTR